MESGYLKARFIELSVREKICGEKKDCCRYR
jgi:hypothetical protein